MRVLFITRKYPPAKGGMETLSYNLTTRYPEEKKIIAMKKRNQIHLVWFLPYCFLYLAFHSRKFELVHLSDLVLIILGAWAKLINGKIKVVLNAHGLDLNFAERNGFLARIYRWYLSFMGKEKNYDLLICNSQKTQEICQKKNFKKTIVIPLGIEIPTTKKSFHKEDLFKIIGHQDPAKKYILTVGRLIKRKGVNWFIKEVMPQLNPEIVYLVVGEADWLKTKENEVALIKKTILEKNLQKRVLLLGKVSEEELEILYYTADLFIMPNISVTGDIEGFGLVALEASGRGLPVIASKVDGLSDAIHHEKNGLIVPEKNSEVFVQLINRILNDPVFSRDLARKGEIYTKEQFGWEKIIRKYTEVFERIITVNNE